MTHTFHIPVLGLAFSIDSPQKVAKYGISSVISIVDDELIERMRKYYCNITGKIFNSIPSQSPDARANRITAYLNLINEIVNNQIESLKSADFKTDLELQKYMSLLLEGSELKKLYQSLQLENEPIVRKNIKAKIRELIKPGDINVNIMSKVDKANTDKAGNNLDAIYSDASAALRGFAQSNLQSSVVLSAGMNPRLYNYIAELPQFLPNTDGTFSKSIILKVSDFRSAMIQAKFLAKKAIWISEFRIESGLNCGGHAFATDGYLMGPILEEFKLKKKELQKELFEIYQKALADQGIILIKQPIIKITAQGGIGTAQEHQFLLDYYNLDSIGWGSPFLLVPEATTMDDDTLKAVANANKNDFYISDSSPLGVAFNNFGKSTAEEARLKRIAQGRPGAPCTKKYLVTNTELSPEPICTASRVYQYTKIKELELLGIKEHTPEYAQKFEEITSKTCLCEGLATSAYLKYDILEHKENTAVAICPGPNTAYFNSIYSLQEMVDHIYGRKDLLASIDRPHLFINELNLYIEYLENYIKKTPITDKSIKYIDKFKNQLLSGIQYYEQLADELYTIENDRDNYLKFLQNADTKIKALNTNPISL